MRLQRCVDDTDVLVRLAGVDIDDLAGWLEHAYRLKAPARLLWELDTLRSIRGACLLLAFCNMRTLYLRNVPNDVALRLERLAAREGISLSAYAVRELAGISRKADNPALLADLPDLGVDIDAVLADLDEGRSRL
jgi:hypothetical protein